MLYAVVARPPVYGGKVVSFDPAAALKVPGVVRVVEIEASPSPAQFNPVGGVAVVARNTWAAIQGRKALTVKWDDGPERGLRFDGLQGGDGGLGAQARQGRPQ
jgi:isoquinoline 1-oxidoreductase beta subunit